MMTIDQINALSIKYNINHTVIYREYIQLVFLQKLYTETESSKIYFKGGTAIHLLFSAPRFSEDLDFTVELSPERFSFIIDKTLGRLLHEESITWKEKQSVSGRRILLTAPPAMLKYPVFVNLDFSFRERVLTPERSSIQSDYPVSFSSYVWHLSKEEVLAEKIRAIMTRRKGRDLYDLWYLLSTGTRPIDDHVKEKLNYYKLNDLTPKDILKRVSSYPKEEFVVDLRPFVPERERERLDDFFDYIQDQIKKSLVS